MIRVLLDTNVVMAGLLSSQGAPAAILDAWMCGEFEVVSSSWLLAELQRVLARPKIRRRISQKDSRAFIDWYKRNVAWVDHPTHVPRVTVDRDDDHIVALAEIARCTVIVSGDSDLRLLKESSTPIMTPRAFVDALD
ncbi:MAG: putative toxin-antitoxin system toxin component, PIN family [Actinomycetota bacterium]